MRLCDRSLVPVVVEVNHPMSSNQRDALTIDLFNSSSFSLSLMLGGWVDAQLNGLINFDRQQRPYLMRVLMARPRQRNTIFEDMTAEPSVRVLIALATELKLNEQRSLSIAQCKSGTLDCWEICGIDHPSNAMPQILLDSL